MRGVSREFLALATACWLAAGCSREDSSPKGTQPAPPAAPSAQANVADCTLETELRPGVPGSPGHLIPSDQNPNGQSELAKLMRDMRDDLARVRDDVVAGKATSIGALHHRMRCAWPTTPADRNAAYDAMSVGYLSAVDEFNAGEATGAAFNRVVQGCVDCHSHTCSGALAAIRPLEIE